MARFRNAIGMHIMLHRWAIYDYYPMAASIAAARLLAYYGIWCSNCISERRVKR